MRTVAVVRINDDGTETHYESVIDAAKKNYATPGNISKAVNHGRKCCGHYWKRAEVNSEESDGTFGHNLRKLREESRKSIATLANDLGWNQTKIWQYETKRLNPSASALRKLADYFGVTMDELWGATDVFGYKGSRKVKHESSCTKA